MSKLALVLPLIPVLVLPLSSQQSPAPQKVTPPSYIAIPQDAAQKPNPVKSSPESLARARKWWNMDCAMCHGKDGDGKGEVAADMKLKTVDFTSPATLKGPTDGEIFYIIKTGHQDMPPEGERIKAEDGWDLVNYVRSLAKKAPGAESKPQP